MRRWSLALVAACVFWGCIDEQRGGPSSDDEQHDAARADASASRDGAAGGRDGAPPDSAPPADAAPAPDFAVPPDAAADACDAWCAKLDTCLSPVCPALGDVGGVAPICRVGCRQPQDQLRKAVGESCDQFVAELYQQVPMLQTLCSPEPPPPECDGICRQAAMCGVPGGAAACTAFCRTVDEMQRQCLAQAMTCDALAGCLNGGMRMPPPERLCDPLCQRESRCVLEQCAAGTLPQGFEDACRQSCTASPPPNAQDLLDATCADVVTQLRAGDPAIDARCDATPDQACATLCDEHVVPCGAVDADACRADCAGWDDANRLCVQRAPDCTVVAGCFGDPAGQDRCQRYCDRLQGCLEEACPPRLLPPQLATNCAAGCLPRPPTDDALAQWEATACADVRETFYQRNRQLRPVCEGDADFRPTPDECAAFCDDALGACIGVGGRAFCLAGCASLTRDQYACALAAQGDCARIATCLQPAP
jgi:hypothetical protein